jgi:hypothetical protein
MDEQAPQADIYLEHKSALIAQPETSRRPGWRFLLLWLSTNIGIALLIWSLSHVMNAITLPMSGSQTQDLPNWNLLIASALSSIVVGTMFGVAQWFVIRPYLKKMPWLEWVSATVIGHLLDIAISFLFYAAILAFLTTFIVGLFVSRSDGALWVTQVSSVMVAGIVGSTVGWTQWAVLQRYVHRAGWWVVAVAGGAFTSAIIEQIAFSLSLNAGDEINPLAITLSRLLLANPIAAGITGLAFLYLLTRRLRQPANEGSIEQSGIPVAQSRTIASRAWKAMIMGSFALGLLLWFFYLTDYSLAGTLSDIFLPPIVFVLGIFAFTWARHGPSKDIRIASRLLTLPAIIGGALYVILAGLIFLPPYTLRSMFLMDEIKTETLVQQVKSPDGSRIAEGYLRWGGYSGSFNKPVFVRVKYTLFPVVERDVYRSAMHTESNESVTLVSWKDDNNLAISTGELVEVGSIRTEVPSLLVMVQSILKQWAEVENN